MPIGTDRPTALQVAPVATIGQEPITPAVSDFMQSFRSGFITVDDIQRRAGEAVVRPSENELKKTQNEQGILDASTLGPQRRDLEAKQLEISINNADLVGQIARQQLELAKRNQVNVGAAMPSESSVIETQQAKEQVTGEQDAAITGTVREQIVATNAPQQRAVIQAYAANVGPVPMELTVMKPGTPKPFDEWVREKHGVDTLPALAAMPEGPNKQGIIDQTFKSLGDDKQIQTEYAAYQKSPQPAVSTKILPEDPAFFTELQNQVVKKQEELGLKAAKLKAFPATEEARVKAELAAPALAIEAGAKIKTDMGQDKSLITPIMQEQAVDIAQAFAKKPNPSNQDDIALIYETIKSFDPNAVREGELALFRGGIGVPGQAEMFLNRLRGNPNAILRPEERKNILSLGDTLKASIYQSTLPVLRTYFERAVASGAPLKQTFTEPQLRRLIGGTAAPTGGGTPPVAGAAQNLAAPGKLGTPGYPKQLNGGYIFETQPDGTKINLGRPK